MDVFLDGLCLGIPLLVRPLCANGRAKVKAGQESDDLDGFTKAHLITKNATNALHMQPSEPFNALFLVLVKSKGRMVSSEVWLGR